MAVGAGKAAGFVGVFLEDFAGAFVGEVALEAEIISRLKGGGEE